MCPIRYHRRVVLEITAPTNNTVGFSFMRVTGHAKDHLKAMAARDKRNWSLTSKGTKREEEMFSYKVREGERELLGTEKCSRSPPGAEQTPQSRSDCSACTKQLILS